MGKKRSRITFANLAEEVLKEADEALSVQVIMERVSDLAPTKKSVGGRRKSNYYLKSMMRGEANFVLKTDKRFVKVDGDGNTNRYQVNLWTLVEE